MHPKKAGAVDPMARIRAALPRQAFQPDPSKLWRMALHALVVVAAYAAAGRIGVSWLLAVPIAVAAVAMSCIAFHAHDLAHGSILRPGLFRRGCEFVFWGLQFVSATMWRRLHNQTHHVHYNTPGDPDRAFFHQEENAATRWYTRLLYPNDEVFPWNPLVFLHFIFYIVRNTVTALLPSAFKLSLVPARPDYRGWESVTIACEWVGIVLLQVALLFAARGQVWPWLIMTVGTQSLTSSITMTYIFTNHFLNPISHEIDPVKGTTSVIVPRWLDELHAHFSYHTEHHLLPTLNSDYYPALSRTLSELYPSSYRRIPITDAWRQLWARRMFVERPREILREPAASEAPAAR